MVGDPPPVAPFPASRSRSRSPRGRSRRGRWAGVGRAGVDGLRRGIGHPEGVGGATDDDLADHDVADDPDPIEKPTLMTRAYGFAATNCSMLRTSRTPCRTGRRRSSCSSSSCPRRTPTARTPGSRPGAVAVPVDPSSEARSGAVRTRSRSARPRVREREARRDVARGLRLGHAGVELAGLGPHVQAVRGVVVVPVGAGLGEGPAGVVEVGGVRGDGGQPATVATSSATASGDGAPHRRRSRRSPAPWRAQPDRERRRPRRR